MSKDTCDRCGNPTDGITTMSMYNEDIICQKCKKEEKERPDYKLASDVESSEVRSGNYNFKGIGYDKLEESEEGQDMDIILEKNKPTNSSLWQSCVAWAKSKYDVWPSAYACGAAAKRYKSKGGKWKKIKK
jgi:hypothetical protein